MIMYTDEIKELLNSTVLNKEDLKIIEIAKSKTSRKRFKSIIPDIYKMMQHGYTTQDLALVYFYSRRTIQIYLKEIGWNLSTKDRKIMSSRKSKKYTLNDDHYRMLYALARVTGKNEDEIVDEAFKLLENKYFRKRY